MTQFQPGGITVFNEIGLGQFDVEISTGTRWYSLNDHLNYRLGAESFPESTVARRRITATSPVYDDTFEVHSVKESVQEKIVVHVLGASQNQVTENLLALEEWFGQFRYNIRRRMGDHMETWLCRPAEWSTDRSHINAHNLRAKMTLTVPRFVKVSYEVIL
jgi:hypothetical protein